MGQWRQPGEALPLGHVIHDLTGRDVVSFGKVGAGSAEGLVLRPARVFGGSQCYIFPSLDTPRRMLVYFYEGNDIEDNLDFLAKVRGRYGRADAAAIDDYLARQYAAFPWWRCHLYLFDTMYRMAKFAWEYYTDERFSPEHLFRRTPGANSFVVGGRTVPAPGPLEGPALDQSDEAIRAGVAVFDRSLAWLRGRFPNVPVTVVYIPSLLSAYRNAGPTVAFSTQHDGRSVPFPSSLVMRNSDRLCGLIRTASLGRGAGFLDARPALRRAASATLIHGPLDWGHPNEIGYRALGKFVAARLAGDDPGPGAADSCGLAPRARASAVGPAAALSGRDAKGAP